MLNIDKNKCTGCALCKDKCPKKCIEMVENEEGFLYPEIINKEDCINCNICNKCCPAKITIESHEKKYFALQIKNNNLLKKCASGGAFASLALKVISLGGNVCGVAQNVDKLKFKIIKNAKDLDILLGSKYFQCNLTQDLYEKIDKLSIDKFFLFSGTPCQVAAIDSKYRKKFGNRLITVEIICQGTPSYKVVRKFYDGIEKKEESLIVEHKFRSKDKYVGRNYLNKYSFENGKIKYYIGAEDSLTKTFQNQIFLRESCYNCNFTQTNRVADYTIGDLWSYNLNNKSIKFKNGVSVMVANSVLSREFIKECQDLAYIEEINGDSVKENLPFNRSVKRPFSRNFSYKLLKSNLSCKNVANICCIKYNIKQIIKKKLRKEK